LLIVEVEDVGRVAYSVRGLSFINHQSSIINHQSSIINHQSPITNHQSPITPRVRLFGFSPEGGTSLPVCVSHRTAAPPTPLKARRALLP
jgi:hypothetical protein